ncbi:MAG TPA: hypothetical protein VM146_10365 [Steroidobacteraceae bacterium]|nr:hypothetical protein [Steroidobacteraceae bacterium]
MNQQQMEQYVSGRMSGEEARAFEDYCVANPEFARQVEFEQRLKAGIAQVARGNTAEFVRSQNPMRWSLAAAAGIVFVLFAGFFIYNLVPRAAPVIMAAVTPDTRNDGTPLRLALIRGNENTPELPKGLVRVAIAGLFDTGFQYSIALDRLDPKRNIDTVATLYGQHPASPVTLEVLVDSDQLEPGIYSLRVRKQAPSEEALDFEFLKH